MATILNGVVIVGFLVAILGSGPVSVSALTPEQRRLVDEAVELYMTQNNVPGMGLTIVEQNGGSVFSIGYGKSRLETDTLATSQTLFAIGSITKSVTSVLVVKTLAEKYPDLGELVLDTPIAQLAPNFNFTFSDRFRSEFTSFRDILSHRTCLASSGLDLMLGMNPNIQDYNYRSRYEPEVCGFRSSWFYNNNLYSLAGSLIGEIAGTSFDQLMNDFFAQLGMVDSRLIDITGSHESHPRMSHAYYRKDNAYHQFNAMHLRRLGVVAGAGAILSTPRDMGQYTKLHLNGGKVGHVQVVPEHAMGWMYKFAMSPHNPAYVETVDPIGLNGVYGYGLGLMLGIHGGSPWISHGGYWPPYESTFALYSQQQLGLYFSINGPGRTGSSAGQMPQEGLQFLIFDILQGNVNNLSNVHLQNSSPKHLLADFEGLNKNFFHEKPSNRNLRGMKRTRVDPEDIVGIYGNPADGEVTIAIESDDSLSVNFGFWGLGKLRRSSETVFAVEWTSPVDDDAYADGIVPYTFLLDFGIGAVDELWLQLVQGGQTNGYIPFYKDRIIDTLPPIPWEPNSCGPTVN